MLKLRNVTSTYGVKVYTDAGEYFGEVDEVVIEDNKVFGWKIRSTKGSFLAKSLSGVKGVLVPHQLVRAIGDVMIISKAALPAHETSEPEE